MLSLMTTESVFETRFQKATLGACTMLVGTLTLNAFIWDAAVLKAEWLISLTEGGFS